MSTDSSFAREMSNHSELNFMDEQIEMTTTGVTSFMNSVKTALQDVLVKVIKEYTKLSKSIVPLVTHLASSIISLLGSIATLIVCDTNGFLKAIHITSIITSFTSMVMGITEIANKYSVKWCPEAAASTAHAMANQLIDTQHILGRSYSEPVLVRANAFDPITWTKAGVCTVVAVLFAGLGLSRLVPFRDIITTSNVIEGMKKTSNTVNGIADFVIGEVLGFESSPDYPACKALEDLAEEGALLQRFSPAHYIQHSQDFYRLKRFLPKLVKASSAPLSDKASKRFMTVKNLLVQIYKNLEEKERSIDAILAVKPRQATVGLLLSGQAGHGKSSFGAYVLQKVAEKLNYPKSIYRLNKRQDGFFDPYGGDALGVYNEWMSMRSNDPLLCDLNTIISSDPMNFEGAALDCKIQPCQLKAAYLTANIDNPEISRVLNEGATMAVWDRLYHVRVHDPLCKGRNQPNPHRNEDYSHLELENIHHTSLSAFSSKKVTVAAVIERITGRCAEAEIYHINTLLKDPDNLTSEIIQQLEGRLADLEKVRAVNNPYEPMGHKPDADGFTDLFANAKTHAREFYIARFQGAIGSGKTRAAEHLMIQMSNAFGYDYQVSEEQGEFIPDKTRPMIYMLDDWIEASNYDQFVTMMNRTHPRSIFIICSNTVFRKRREMRLKYMFENVVNTFMGNRNIKPWDCTHFDKHPGFLRRCGLQGYVRMKPDMNATDDLIQINESLNRTYTLDAHMIIRDAYDQIKTYDEIVDIHHDLYRSFLMRPTDFSIIEGLPPMEDESIVGAKINAAGTREIMECLKSTSQKFAAYNGTHPTVSMFLSSKITGAGSASQTTMFDWAMTEEVCDDPAVFRSAFSRFCGKFNRAFPGLSLKVQLERENITLYYVNGTAYIFDPSKSKLDLCFSHTDSAVHYKRNSEETVIVTIDELLSASVRKEYTGGMMKLSYSEITRLNRYISSVLEANTQSSFKTYYKLRLYKLTHKPNPMLLKLEAELRNHPFFWAGIGLLFTGVAAGGLYFLVKKLFFSQERSQGPQEVKFINPTPNSADVKESKGKSHSQTALRKIALKVNSDSPKESKGQHTSSRVLSKIVKSNATQVVPEQQISQELAKLASGDDLGKVKDALKRFVASVEGGSEPMAALCQSLTITGTSDVRESPTLSTVHANMLRASDMIPQRESRLAELHRSLRKYAVKLRNDNECFGFALKANYILTVSHIFKNAGEKLEVVNDGKVYQAKVVLIDRPRDLAVVYVTDRTFPALADTRRFFHSIEDRVGDMYGYFLRCGPDPQIIGGGITYYQTIGEPMDDDLTPTFKFTSQAVVFSAAALHRVRDFIQDGDCGFPLVTLDRDNAYKIAGIHCAYNTHEQVFFSSFTRADHENFLTRAMQLVKDDISTMITEVDLRPCWQKATANAGINMSVDNVIVDGDKEFLLPTVYTHALASIQDDTRYTNYSDRLDILGYSKELSLRSNPKLGHKYLEIEGMKTDLLTLPAAFSEDFIVDDSALAKDVNGRSDALFTQCLKYDNRSECSFNLENLNHAIELVRQDCVNRYGNCKFLRLYNVINGIPGKQLTPVDTSTSAGPLLKITSNVNIKAPLFKVTEPQNGRRTLVFNDTEPAKLVRTHYETFVNSLHDGGPPPLIVSKDCAKVELIDAEKARAGKVRLFNEVDLSVNLMLKHFFGDFAEKVMANHEQSPIRMGQDPYRCSSHIYRQFAQISGNIISTDFSAFDKQLPAVLISAFCDIVGSCYEGESHPNKDLYAIYGKLAMALTYVLHTCRGTIYFVDRGNESGTFVTTIMNSVSVQILTYYTVVRKWYIIFKFTPTLSEVLSQTRLAILGDDRTFKCTKALGIVEEDFVNDSVEFCLKCTPAKTEGYIDFCSRSFTWDSYNQVVFPALKESSTVSQLRWYKDLSMPQVIVNLDNVLFEAALHKEKQIFEDCLHDVRLICKHFNLPSGSISFYDREIIRKRFVLYMRDDDEFDRLSQQVQRELQFSSAFDVVESYHRAFSERIAKSATVSTADTPERTRELQKRVSKVFSRSNDLMTDPALNPISALLERLREVDPNLAPEEKCEDVPDGFVFDLKVLGFTASAVGPSKKAAKRAAYAEMYSKCLGELQVRRANARPSDPDPESISTRLAKDYMFRSVKIHLGIAADISQNIAESVIVLARDDPEGDSATCGAYRFVRLASGDAYAPSATAQSLSYKDMSAVYLRQRGTYESGDRVYLRYSKVVANSTTASGTVPPADAANNPGISSIPSMANPVPLSIAPTMHENPSSTLGAYEVLADVETYNTSGPPNMLSAGAIAFDIKDLVYNQFMDCDTMFTFTDDTKDGSIILQIPYAASSSFLNPYIKQYIAMHERFAGDFMFRATLVGNQTFSGLVACCWQPAKVAGDTIKVSEAQKYSYAATAINEMWNKGYVLKDARQDLFWRSVKAENPKEEAYRPHLVFFVIMNAQSPLKEGISVRMRIASKLASNFQVANPILPAVPPAGPDSRAYGLSATGPGRLIGSPLLPTIVRPISKDAVLRFYFCMDGNTWLVEPSGNIATDFQTSSWPNHNDQVPWTRQCSADPDFNAMQQCYLANEQFLVYYDITRAPDFSKEFKSSTLSGGEVSMTSLTGYAICRALEVALKAAKTQDLANPGPWFGDVLKSKDYTDTKGMAKAYSYAEYLVPNPPKEIKMGTKKVPVGSFRVFNMTTSFGDVQLTFITLGDFTETGMVAFNMGQFVNGLTQIKEIGNYGSVEAMPTGWRHVAISADVPYVYNEAARQSVIYNHPSVLSLLDYLNYDISPTQCLQFTIGDMESGRDIAAVRYFKDRRSFAINAGSSNQYYGTSARPVDRMYITSIGVIERTNDFPLTDVSSTFLDNQVHPERMRHIPGFR
nr:polyprotein [buhirugu virus 13]